MNQFSIENSRGSSVGFLAVTLLALCVSIVAVFFASAAVVLTSQKRVAMLDPLPRTVTWESVR